MTEKVAIIGAGITGASIARVLSKYKDLDIHLIEKRPDVGWGCTKANTGIIHPGHEDDPEEFPLRAELCVKGNRLWREWSEELNIPVEWPGELMIAREEDDIDTLEEFLKIGEKNGVEGLEIVDEERLRELEPTVTEEAVGALWAPTAGRIEPWEATIALVENAVDNGVKTHLGTEVVDVVKENKKVKGVETIEGKIETDIMINAGGLFADEISKMAGAEDFELTPRRGEYYLFKENAEPCPDKLVHPTPTPKTKGVFVVKTVEGNLMLGPTAENLSIKEKENRATTEEGLDFVWEKAEELVKDLPGKDEVSKTFAGLRPEPPSGDYIIETYEEPEGFINAAGIRSPGLTSAPAIAHQVEELIQEEVGIQLVEKKDWFPKREAIQRFSSLSESKKECLIDEDPSYGKVLCMCKEVTEAEVKEAVERMKKIGAEVTLDGVKFRTLAMFGFCQGSFCRSRLAGKVADELSQPLWRVTQKGQGTEYGIGDIKILQKEEGNDG